MRFTPHSSLLTPPLIPIHEKLDIATATTVRTFQKLGLKFNFGTFVLIALATAIHILTRRKKEKGKV
jgi:hypothetical protein